MTCKRKLLRIEAPHYTAGVVWELDQCGPGWYPLQDQCAPILRWMLAIPPAKAALHVGAWLYSRRFQVGYQWLPADDQEPTA